MTYVHGESKLAKARAAIEAARLEEAQAMNALIRQHTAALRRRYNQQAPNLEQTTTERTQAFLNAARLAQEWAETRYPETWETCRGRLDKAAREAGTIQDYRGRVYGRGTSQDSRARQDRVAA